MNRADRALSCGALLALASFCAYACGGSEKKPEAPPSAGAAVSKADAGVDQSRCDYKGRNDREAVEGTGPGATFNNIRKVYAIIGQGDDARKVLMCREVDTNLDGQKDVVRTYNEKGDPLAEQADANYDGQIDTWMTFTRGHIAKVQIDSNNDGQPDITKYYVEGKLSRMNRDSNYDGKPDIWEIYNDGALERMGFDLDHDGHVDRWDRDLIVQRQLDEKERAEEEAAEKKKKSDQLDGGVTDARVSVRHR